MLNLPVGRGMLSSRIIRIQQSWGTFGPIRDGRQ
jgi:hypothetical protein